MIDCKCHLIPSEISVVYMGYEDNHTLDTYDRVVERGGKYWWLFVSQCRVCKKYLLIAQEERQNDLWCVLPLNDEQVAKILNDQIWPSDFDRYETLLQIGLDKGRTFHHYDPFEGSVKQIMQDLILENPSIKLLKLAELLSLDIITAHKIYEDINNTK